jgi:hypothetical protein
VDWRIARIAGTANVRSPMPVIRTTKIRFSANDGAFLGDTRRAQRIAL